MNKTVMAAAVGMLLVLAGFGVKAGADYGRGMVRDQLRAERIIVPPASELGDTPGMLPYAGQQVLDGEAAKAYADEFIAVHMEGIGGGRSYAEISHEAMTKPNNEGLQQARMALFMGSTLRGLLLSVYGWDLVARIAGAVALVLMFAGAVLYGGALGVALSRRH